MVYQTVLEKSYTAVLFYISQYLKGEMNLKVGGQLVKHTN